MTLQWFESTGMDEYGRWAEVEVSGVRVRFRWIPPGRFWMGSPEGEEGRWEDEGPRHLVTLTRGYWLGEVPVTQALWEAVMGTNPSGFQTADRPVERVCWEDVQRFLARLGKRSAGLSPRLPTEAEWEHACRAGTETGTYAGEIHIRGESDAPVLDEIAWYGGNSGVGFELADGYNSSNWPEKQHPHTKAGTRRVGLKRANAWGLHDMLGNVWEWCADGRRSYTAAAVIDPVEPLEEEAVCVVRGGSWLDIARGVRAAYRFAYAPSFRFDFLGFRLARDA